MKLFYYDIETTGLSFWKHGIHQISFIIEIDGAVKEKMDYKVRPNPAALIEDEALTVAGVTRGQISKYFEMKMVHRILCEVMAKYVDKFDKTDKFFLVGYNNASFDNAFFRAWFKQCGDDYFGSWFWSSSIDVMVLASQYLITERHLMENFKQSTVAKHIGIEVDESRLHDALYDVELMMKIYKYMYPI